MSYSFASAATVRTSSARRTHPSRTPAREEVRDAAWFAARAQQVYDAGNSLRNKDARLDQLRYDDYPIAIPAAYGSRAVAHYTRMASNRVEKAKGLIGDSEGAVVAVAQLGTTNKAENEREVVQNWDQSFLREIEPQSEGRRLSEMIKDDLVYRSRAFVKCLPHPAAWAGIDDSTLPDDLADAFGITEAMRAANAAMALQDQVRAQAMPFLVQWVPASCVYPGWDSRDGKLAFVWEFRDLPVERVLTDYLDENGEPLARCLAESVAQDRQGVGLTDRDRCTVATYADRDCITILVLGTRLSDSGDRRSDAFQHGDDEIIWQGEHGLGRVPYAHGIGRHTTSDDPARFYLGLIDPVEAAIRSLDMFETQADSVTRAIAWNTLVLEKPAQQDAFSDTSSDSEPIALDENTVYTGLGPGERLTTPPLIDSAALAWLSDRKRSLVETIDQLTFGPASYGHSGVSSGYLQSQLQEAGETTLEASERGMNDLLTDLLHLAHQCARVMMAEDYTDQGGIGPIPARFVDEDGARYVTLKEEHVAHSWDITVRVRSKPAGGEAAQFQTLKAQADAGIMSWQTVAEKMGIRNPQREQQRIIEERVLGNQKFLDFVVEQVEQRTLALLQQRQARKLPQKVQLPAALAGQLQSPLLTGLLPPETYTNTGMTGPRADGDGGTGNKPLSGLPGLPNMAVTANPIHATPTPTEQMVMAHAPGNARPGGIGGNPTGQALALNGSMARMDMLNSLR